MTIPANITTELAALQTQLTNAEPLSSASAPTITALQLNAHQLLDDLDDALIDAAGANTNNMSGSILFTQNPIAGSSIVLGGQPIPASGSWTTSTNKITLSKPAPSWIVSGMQLYDRTTSKVIGTIIGTSGATLTLLANAQFPSQGASDLLFIQSTVTFVASNPLANQVQIGASLGATLLTLLAFLNKSTDINIALCLYSLATNSNTLQIVFKTNSTTGSSFTVATTVPGSVALGSALTSNNLDDWNVPADPQLIVKGFLGVVENATDQSTIANMIGYVGRAAKNLNQLV